MNIWTVYNMCFMPKLQLQNEHLKSKGDLFVYVGDISNIFSIELFNKNTSHFSYN